MSIGRDQDLSIFAAGSVFYGKLGAPAFPLRLADTVFQACLQIRQRENLNQPCILFDPCCGTAYHLATMAYLNWEYIAGIFVSDVDPAVVPVAARNLSLLSAEGLDRRISEIQVLFDIYHRESHAGALKATRQLRALLNDLQRQHKITTYSAYGNALNPNALISALQGHQVDIVFSDIPYGQHSHWHSVDNRVDNANNDSTNKSVNTVRPPVWGLLEALTHVLHASSLVAIAANKDQPVTHEKYRQLRHIKHGKPHIVILHLQNGAS